MDSAKPTFAQKEILNKSTLIILLKGVDRHGFPKFCFFAIRGDNLDAFSAQIATGEIDLDKFGIVIEEGIGEPSDEIWQKMQHEYALEKYKTSIIEMPRKFSHSTK